MTDLKLIKNKLVQGRAHEVSNLVKEALNNNYDPKELLNKSLIAGMDEIAEKWRKNEVFIPEVLMAARSMKMAMTHIEPLLINSGIEPIGRIVIGTVKGDLHDIGKNLVTMMLRGAGFYVEDIGIDQKAENFLKAVKEKGCTMVGLSALITTTMPAMKEIIDEFKSQGLRSKVKIGVGGAPVTEGFAKEIGADGYAADAARAVELFRGFVGS
ncbi:MAG: corrinoid protein [Elusimicrobiota bacterium]